MSLAAELHNAHKVRVATIAAKAAEHEARKQTALVAELKACCEPKPEPKPAPEPIEDGWVERQIEKHKQPWFTVVTAVNVAPPISSIQRAVCEVYGVELRRLLSPSRSADITIPRHVSMYLAKEMTNLTIARIASATGNRDKTCVRNAVSKVERLLKNESFLRKVDLVRAKVRMSGDELNG